MSRAPSPPPSLSPTLAPTVAIMQTPPSTEALGNYPSLPPSPPSSQQPPPQEQHEGRSSQSEPPDSVPVPPASPPAAPTTPPSPTAAGPPAKRQYAITLLLVSGRRRTLNFDIETSVGSMKDTIWNTWPIDWADEQPPSASFLRILYLGRILTDETLLSSLNLPHFNASQPPSTTDAAPNDSVRNHPLSEEGQPITTVFHVSVRSFAPAGGEGDIDKSKKGRRRRMLGGSGAGGGNAATTGDVPGDAGPGAPEGERRGCCGCIIC